jgi:hypothetical protein
MELNGVTSLIHAERKCSACHHPESGIFPEENILRKFPDLESLARPLFRVDEPNREKDPGEAQQLPTFLMLLVMPWLNPIVTLCSGM